jgi:Glycosyl transferases group 1
MIKRPLTIVISTVYFGGIGGSERRLKTIVESMPENDFYIFSEKVIHDGYFPATQNFSLNSPLDPSTAYDAYIYFAGMAPRYLGNDYSFKKKIALINGTEEFSDEHLFDCSFLSGRDGLDCLKGISKHFFAIPDVTLTHPKTVKAVAHLPNEYVLSVFNPYGSVKGRHILSEVARHSKFPIVWSYNDMTRSRNFNMDYTAMAPTDNVIQFRNLSQEELHYLYKKAKAYVCFSIKEGFGWAVADAFVYDLPILSRNTGIVTFMNTQKGVTTYETTEELISSLVGGHFEKPNYDKSIFDEYDYRKRIAQVMSGA